MNTSAKITDNDSTICINIQTNTFEANLKPQKMKLL